jgi:hypothetical protein
MRKPRVSLVNATLPNQVNGILNSSGETLVTLRIVVFQADLEFDGLDEVAPLLASRTCQDFLDVAPHT